MGSTPTTTTDITAEFLTDALRASGVIAADASVASVEVEPGSAGVGFMGEVGKLSVTYAGADDAPSSIIAKFPTQSPEISAMMRPTRVFEREHRFYAELASETPVRTPIAYHVVCETNPDPDVAETYLLLMEDLSALTEGDQVAGVSIEQATAAMIGLAKHHARFWGGAGLDAADFIPPIDGPLNQAGQAIYEASLPGFKQVFGDVLTPEMDALADAYTAANPSLLAAFGRMPTTLVHFDFRADNLFFDSDGSVVVIDWQAISRGGGAADVGYFLSQNLAVENRRAHEDSLLRAYHDTLVENGVGGYDYETFFDDYRLAIMYGWIIPVFAVGSLDVSSERAMELWRTVIDRTQTAIADHNGRRILEHLIRRVTGRRGSGMATYGETDEQGIDSGCPVQEIDFFDADLNDCPYPAYRTMRDEAPVWFDERLGMFHITRYDDVLMVLKDTERFSNERKKRGTDDRTKKILALYKEKGWVPAPTLAGRDDPNHKQMRGLFNHAFRPRRIRELEPQLESIAHELIDDFIGDGRCDWVRQFAVPLPLLMIGMQMGADPSDIWRIKAWTDAWVQRLGMMQTEEEALWSTEMEIEAQHYFQPIFDRLRENPEDSLISDSGQHGDSGMGSHADRRRTARRDDG